MTHVPELDLSRLLAHLPGSHRALTMAKFVVFSVENSQGAPTRSFFRDRRVFQEIRTSIVRDPIERDAYCLCATNVRGETPNLYREARLEATLRRGQPVSAFVDEANSIWPPSPRLFYQQHGDSQIARHW